MNILSNDCSLSQLSQFEKNSSYMDRIKQVDDSLAKQLLSKYIEEIKVYNQHYFKSKEAAIKK
jgi:hypothetical protein